MVVKIINGMRIHEPPYTQAEDDEFYKACRPRPGYCRASSW